MHIVAIFYHVSSHGQRISFAIYRHLLTQKPQPIGVLLHDYGFLLVQLHIIQLSVAQYCSVMLSIWSLSIAQFSWSYFARSPPISFLLVFAQTRFASPIDLTLVLTGTATGERCIPISVSPMSNPAFA